MLRITDTDSRLTEQPMALLKASRFTEFFKIQKWTAPSDEEAQEFFVTVAGLLDGDPRVGGMLFQPATDGKPAAVTIVWKGREATIETQILAQLPDPLAPLVEEAKRAMAGHLNISNGKVRAIGNG